MTGTGRGTFEKEPRQYILKEGVASDVDLYFKNVQRVYISTGTEAWETELLAMIYTGGLGAALKELSFKEQELNSYVLETRIGACVCVCLLVSATEKFRGGSVLGIAWTMCCQDFGLCGPVWTSFFGIMSPRQSS